MREEFKTAQQKLEEMYSGTVTPENEIVEADQPSQVDPDATANNKLADIYFGNTQVINETADSDKNWIMDGDLNQLCVTLEAHINKLKGMGEALTESQDKVAESKRWFNKGAVVYLEMYLEEIKRILLS